MSDTYSSPDPVKVWDENALTPDEKARLRQVRTHRAARQYAPGMRRRLFHLLRGTRKAMTSGTHPGSWFWELQYRRLRADLAAE